LPSQILGELFKAILATRHGNNVETTLGEAARDTVAESGAGSCNQHDWFLV
jgi:hypothetical protein